MGMRFFLVVAGAGCGLSGVLFAQAPCPLPAAGVATYDVCPIPAGFTSIDGAPGATMLAAPTACGDDTTSAVVALPFSFPFFGAPKTSCYISANGHLRFQAAGPSASASAFNNHPGDPALPNEVVAPWWDDLEFVNGPGLPAAVWTKADPGVFTIEWSNVSEKCAPACVGDGGRLSFQAKLFATGNVEFHYDPTSVLVGCTPCMPVPTGGIWGFNWATSATIGLEGALVAGAVTGVDATGRGAGNDSWPRNNWKFVPVSGALPTNVTYTVTTGTDPFVHIEGAPGTVTVPQICLQIGCPDDDDSARQTGTLIPLPWKFNLYGRTTKNANMNPNGFVSLGPGWFSKFWSFTGVAPHCTPTSITNTYYPNGALYPFHGDLMLDAGDVGDQMYYRMDGSAGCRVMTWEWHHLHPFTAACPGLDPSNRITFQVKIYEGGAAGETDRIRFFYDTADFSGAFTGTASAAALIKSHTGLQFDGPSVLGCPLMAPPAASATFTPCTTGTVHYYGDGTAGPGGFVPEIGTNGIRPAAGNPFALHLTKAAPTALVFLLLDTGGALPGFRIPVPCGGLALPGCPLYVNLASSSVIPVGVTGGASPGDGVFCLPLPIPSGTPSGATGFAQFAVINPGFGCLGLASTTEAVSVTTG